MHFLYLKKSVAVIFALTVALILGATALGQHEHDMPGMSKPKTVVQKKAAKTRKRKSLGKRRRKSRAAVAATPRRARTNVGASRSTMNQEMPGKNMPQAPAASVTPSTHEQMSGMTMPQTPAATASPTPHEHMPGMNMPQTPAATSSPKPHEHMPGMTMPQAPAATASPTPHEHMPGMTMPQAPAATASPTPHEHMPGMNMPAATATPSPGATDHMNMPGMNTHEMNPDSLIVMNGDDMGIRVGSSETNVMSMGAMGSGTSWQPASGSMNMLHKESGKWLLMFHYNATVGVNAQGGPRGVTKFESANWFMPMAYHKLGKGTLQLRGMFSFEPFTFPPGGSPLLFQTGETYKGQPLIDRQHPHDLFMELSAQYTHPIGERAAWFTYFGYPGEPALGPVAFMHRQSASENPSATLSHHLQDSTHISFGVLTSGFTYRWIKLEGSLFNGREPDENRYDFDSHKWNSRSARLSVMPNNNWALQISYGFLRSPEGQEPETDIRRATASLQYNKKFMRGNWASAIVWGRNHASNADEVHNLNGYTLESTVNFLDKNYLYTRLELVDKDDLLRAVDRARLGITDHHPSFRIGAYTFGGARDIFSREKILLAIGSDLTFYSKPAVLDQFYGNNPVSWKLFLRIRPGKMNMSSLHGTH